MADPLILGLYALSRSIAGDRLRKKEKEAMKPVTYVRVGNETVEFDKDDPDHKDAPVFGVKIGQNFMTEPETFKQLVRSPSGESVTIDQYRSSVMDTIEKDATSRDFGASLSTVPEKIPEILGSKIAIPPVIGTISSRGKIDILKNNSTKASKEVYGGYINDKWSGWMSLPDYEKASDGKKPTISAIDDGLGNVTNSKAYAGLSKNGKSGVAGQKGFSTPTFKMTVQNKDKTTDVNEFKFTSANTTISSQLADVNSQFHAYIDHFGTLKASDPKVVKLRDSLIPLMVKDSVIKPPEGADANIAMSVNYQDGAAYLKAYPNLAKIPGMVANLQFSQNRINEETFMQSIKASESPLDKNKTLHAQATSGDTTFNFTVTFPHTHLKKNDLAETATLIANDRVADGATQAQKNAAIEPLIDYVQKRDNFGNSRGSAVGPDGKKIPKPANQQHKLIFYTTLRTTPAAIGKGSLYAVFKKVVAPRMFRAKFGDFKTSPDDEQSIKNIYATDIADLPNGYQIGHRLIMNNQEGEVTQSDNSTLEQKIFNSMVSGQYITTKTMQDFYADSTNKKLYSATTIGLLKRYKATYFNPDGTPNNISTAVGNVIMMKDGTLYWLDTIKNAFGSLVDDGDQSDMFASIKGMKDIRGGELTEIGMLESISDEFYKRSEFGKNDAMNASRKTEMQSIAKALKSDDEKTKALAQRAYYRMMIAYQMAAAIQGGTGGRTISDQDVDNILKALGGAGLLVSPEKEIAGINAALTLMQDIYQFNKHMTGSPAERNAALKHQEFITEGNPNGIIRSPMGVTGVQAAVFIANARGDSTNTFGGRLDDAKKTIITDAEVLESINKRQIANGDNPFKSADEAKKALGDKTFENQKLRIKRL